MLGHHTQLTVIPSTSGVSEQKALDYIKPVIFEPSNLSSEDQSFDSCSKHSDFFPSISEGANTSFCKTNLIHFRHSALRMDKALKCHHSGCLSLNLSSFHTFDLPYWNTRGMTLFSVPTLSFHVECEILSDSKWGLWSEDRIDILTFLSLCWRREVSSSVFLTLTLTRTLIKQQQKKLSDFMGYYVTPWDAYTKSPESHYGVVLDRQVSSNHESWSRLSFSVLIILLIIGVHF